ncbi:MAG: hypothetical protein KBC73_05505 [Burkholderiaceae bacterium]|nr:hypothetical protein [Burkholderiaceae bacterium]
MWQLLAEKAVGPLAGGIGKGIGDAIGGGGGGPFMGGSATSGAYGVTFDKAGQVFNFGNSNDTTATSDRTTTDPAGAALAPVQAGGSPWMMIALGLVAAGLVLRKKG